ncbi:2476_t:CDS:2, partial [Entrophospora sp. SA101]
TNTSSNDEGNSTIIDNEEDDDKDVDERSVKKIQSDNNNQK